MTSMSGFSLPISHLLYTEENVFFVGPTGSRMKMKLFFHAPWVRFNAEFAKNAEVSQSLKYDNFKDST